MSETTNIIKASRSHTATVKFGTAYDAPWLVLGGDSQEELKLELAAAFGLECDSGTTAAELLVAASRSAQGLWSLVNGVGGEIEGIRKATPATAPAPAAEPEPEPVKKPARKAPAKKADPKPEPAAETPAGDADAPATITPPWDTEDPVLAALAAVETMDDFKRVWKANQEAFTRPEVQEAARETQKRVKGS